MAGPEDTTNIFTTKHSFPVILTGQTCKPKCKLILHITTEEKLLQKLQRFSSLNEHSWKQETCQINIKATRLRRKSPLNGRFPEQLKSKSRAVRSESFKLVYWSLFNKIKTSPEGKAPGVKEPTGAFCSNGSRSIMSNPFHLHET